MTQQPQQPAGWGPPPPAQSKTDHRPWYKRGWVLFVAGLALGGVIGSAAAGATDSGPQAATDTSIVFRDRDRKVFTTYCEDLESATERKACEDVKAIHEQELREAKAAATTATTKPKPTTPPPPTFNDGLYKVGEDIKPGAYKTSGGGSGGADCYYARLRTDDTNSIITNNISSGPMRMTVHSTDGYVEFNGGCEWRKAG